jgi:hypothetical protein
MSTPRAIARRLRSQAKPALRLYCQVCERQFRDQRALDTHQAGRAHQERIIALAGNESACRALFSERFFSQFLLALAQLSRASQFPDRRVQATKVYDYVTKDPRHVRLHATRWQSLRRFLQWLLAHCPDRVVFVSEGETSPHTSAVVRLQPERVWLVSIQDTVHGNVPKAPGIPLSNKSILELHERRLGTNLPQVARSSVTAAEAHVAQSAVYESERDIVDVQRLVMEFDSWNPPPTRATRLAAQHMPAQVLHSMDKSWIPRYQAGDLVVIRNKALAQGALHERLGVVLQQAPVMHGCVVDVVVSLLPAEPLLYVLRMDQDELELADEARRSGINPWIDTSRLRVFA